MKRISTTLVALLMSAALTVPAWGQGTSRSNQQCSKKTVKHHVKRHVKHHHKVDRHKQKVLMQFKVLKLAYNKSIQDARQMFLEYLGSGVTCATTDVEAIRQEYEQQIAQLNETITSQEQQIAGLNTTITSQEQQITGLNATITSQEQQITGLNATITSQEQQITGLNATIASQEQQLAEATSTIASLQLQLENLAASHQQEMDNLAAAKDQECSAQLETAYNDGVTAGMETCATTTPAGDPQPSGSISTGSYYPYAVDVDGSGNTYIVEKNYRSVVGYDSSGSQIASWTSGTLVLPVDLAIDSQGDIFILDQGAAEPLQKYSPSGQPMAFVMGASGITFAQGMYIDSQDNVYVTDMGGAYGGRILKFDSTGALVATLGEVDDANLFGDMYTDITVDEANQTIYIVTQMNHMVAKFGMDGTYLGAWQGDLRNPNSIAVGPQGRIYVADTYNNQIDQYDADGNLTYTIDSAQLYRPSRIVVDGTGKLYIAVESYQSVQVYQ
jgi:sugar lactone lactonase YvrE/uncharacterized coiled-coil protein SlyX